MHDGDWWTSLHDIYSAPQLNISVREEKKIQSLDVVIFKNERKIECSKKKTRII